ncbi:hypothetical protein OG943_00255 [Amycolatopsis sp. NBC_00345]|uniref:hypothetical protein n=1 Tax=Amycolatopsis sp. NBC_00345 TaxID=2975955 RepID=UPI002E272709
MTTEHVRAAEGRARRTYLVAVLVAPVVLAALGVVGLVRQASVATAVVSLVLAAVLAGVGVAVRGSARWWPPVAGIGGLLAGLYSAVTFLLRGDDGRFVVAVALLVVLALLPWLVARQAAAVVTDRTAGAGAGQASGS